MAIAQTQTEQASRPSMTAFTTQCACQNSAISETSVAGIGKVAASISGILSTLQHSSLHALRPKASGSKRLPVPQPRIRRGDMRQRGSPLSTVSLGARPEAGSGFPCQHVKTKADRRDFCAPNQTIIWVNARLPKGNPHRELWPQAAG